MGTEITALLHSTFAHCVALHCPWLQEVFLNCVVLQEAVIPTELSDMGNRAFCGCQQLQRFTSLDWGDIEQWVQVEHNVAQASQAAVPRNDRLSATATLVPATPIGWALQVVTHRPTA